MANTKTTTTKKPAAKKTTTTTKKPTAKANATPDVEVVEKQKPEAKVEAPIRPKEIDIEDFVTVRNGFQGKLVYESKRSGEIFIWDEFGSEQEMTLKELRDAKNSCKAMFKNNWFMFDEEFQWVLAYLGVANFYDNAINIEEFDDVLTSSASVIRERISNLSEGQRVSLTYRARQLVLDGVIDSIKAIKTLEDILSIELIEK